MAYDRYTWVDGEVITAQKLNHIEEGIENGDNGYECIETSEELFSETVTTSGEPPYVQGRLAYVGELDADILTITFDGVEYQVTKGDAPYGGVMYGDLQSGSPSPSFERYPFNIQYFDLSDGKLYSVYTATVGEHTIKAEVVDATVTTTDCFGKAVNQVIDGVEIVDIVQTGTDSTTGKPLINLSYDDLGQIMQKYNNGKAVVRLQLLDNASLEYYMNGARLYVDTFYASSSSMTGDYYVLHAHGTSKNNVSGTNIRIYDIRLDVGRSSNRLDIRAIQISNE